MYVSKYLKNKALKLFDVTLRDGLQSIPKIYNLNDKMDILTKIITERNPYSIEIGSIVSPKILPQMANSIEFYKEIHNKENTINKLPQLYMLTPNVKSLDMALHNNIKNLSLITSVSESFQKKNTNKTLYDNKREISVMMKLTRIVKNTKVKLYISCISECPIAGNMDVNLIINEILYYYYVYDELDEICLSDTCGTLHFTTFKTIIDELIKRSVDLNKISLHLHNQPNRPSNVGNIIVYALKKGIYRYDVSYMPDIGGCSVTMDSTHGNLSYDQIHECL